MVGMPRESFRRTTGLAIEMLTALYDDPDTKRFTAERIAQLRTRTSRTCAWACSISPCWPWVT